jgi:integrase
MHWHLFRHGFAQTALRRGAEIGMVQEMPGHASNMMTRRCAGQVRQSEAARRMPRFAPIQGADETKGKHSSLVTIP